MNDFAGILAGVTGSATFSPAVAAAIAASIAAASLLRGLTGFGFAIAAVPLLSLFIPPVVAVPLVVCLQLFGNLFEVKTSLAQCDWKTFRWLTLGALIGSPVGVLALSLLPADAARLLIAAATAVAVLILTRGFAFVAIPGASLSVPVGLVAGLFNGLAGMPGPPVIAYYMSLPLTRVVVRASLNMFFLANSIFALASALVLDLVNPGIVLVTALALPLMFVGQNIGLRFFHLGSDRTHRLIAVVCLAAIALGAAIKGLSGHP